MGGGPSQNTNSVQSTNQNFNDLSSMIQNMSTQGLTNYQNLQNVASDTTNNQNTVNTNNQNTTGTNFSNSTGTSTGAQTGATAFQNNPWAPAIPQLNNILSAIGGQGMSMTPAQQAALGATSAAAGTMPNFGPSASGAVGNMFNSINGIPQAGMWGSAFNNFANSMSPFTSAANLNPMNTPGFSDAMNTMNEDITRQIQGMYAGSGRDPTGAGSFAKSLGRGLSQGEGNLIQGQFNQNVADYLGANNNILSGAERMATGTTGLIQTPLQNEIAGINNAPNAGQLWMGPSVAQLGAANTAYGLPYSNIAIPAGVVQQIAQLGQQGTGQTAGTQAGTQTGAQTGGGTSSTLGGSTSDVTGTQQQTGSTVGSGSQQTQKTAAGTTTGQQSGTQQGTTVGNSTTTGSQNPFATAAGVGLGLFSMFG